MSAEVIGLRGSFVLPGELSAGAAEVVHELEKAIAAAKSGKYEAMAVVLVAKDGDTEIDTYRTWRSGPLAPPTRLFAGVDMLKIDIATGQISYE